MITAFLGKGGVGKTSIASAYALYCSRRGKTVIVSSDFMPSLRYVFREKRENLDVIELSEREVAEKWKARYGEQVASVLKEFVDVEDWIIDHIASSPGVAEEFMIANIVELEESGKYDHVVWDTAASSSTMHLLLLEREFYEHLDRDVRIYLRLKDRFRVSRTFAILEEWKQLADSVWKKILESNFFIITTQDELSIIQSSEIRGDLDSMGIGINGMIYNRCRGSKLPLKRGLVEIPELNGTPLEIVEQMEGYISPVFRETQSQESTQRV